MICILTEDNKSGFKFFKKISEVIFDNNVTVFNTSYKSKTKGAGNSKFKEAIEHLINDKVLSHGDFLFIALDNMIGTTPEFKENIKAIQKDINLACKLLQRNKIQYEISEYTCWEEIMLSFKYLLEFCNDEIYESDKAIQLYNEYKQQFLKGTTNYLVVFKDEIEKGNTVEYCIANLLRKLSGTETFRTFKITKEKVGHCWYIDCDRPEITTGAYCRNCYAVRFANIKDAKKGKNRLLFLYNNSLFRKIFKEIYIRIQNNKF